MSIQFVYINYLLNIFPSGTQNQQYFDFLKLIVAFFCLISSFEEFFDFVCKITHRLFLKCTTFSTFLELVVNHIKVPSKL
jgi:hypothetical protein